MIAAIFGRVWGWLLGIGAILAGGLLWSRSIREDERDAIAAKQKVADAEDVARKAQSRARIEKEIASSSDATIAAELRRTMREEQLRRVAPDPGHRNGD